MRWPAGHRFRNVHAIRCRCTLLPNDEAIAPMSEPPSRVAPGGWPGASRFAREWAASVAGTSYVPLSREEIEAMLYRFTVDLAGTLVDGATVNRVAYQVGMRLVEADLVAPEALGRTVSLVGGHLLDALGLPEADFGDRRDLIVQGLATGYARALRDRTLDEQEAVRRAVLAARE